MAKSAKPPPATSGTLASRRRRIWSVGAHATATISAAAMVFGILLASGIPVGEDSRVAEAALAGEASALTSPPEDLPMEWVAPEYAPPRAWIAESAINPRVEVVEGDGEWIPTLLDLEDPAWAADERIRCAQHYARDIHKSCAFRTHLVAERVGRATGRIVYSAARLVEPSETMLEAHEMDENCAPFVACVARSRLGESLALPPGDREFVPLTQALQAKWQNAEAFEPEKVEMMIHVLSRAVADRPEEEAAGETPTPIQTYKHMSRGRQLDYLKRHLARLRKATEK